MKNVLLTGGSHSEIPIIDALHEMGYTVITVGTNEDGLGHKKSDLYIYGDFSDKEFVLSVAKDNNVVGIVSGCNDYAYLSTAYACEKLGFAGHDSLKVSQLIHHKDKFRSLLNSCGLPTPFVEKIHNLDELISSSSKMKFPVLIKPVDLTGGKGVKVCNNTDELAAAFNDAIELTREDYIIAEEYISGTNHGASALIKDGKVVFSFFDNEEYYLNKYLVSGANAPSDLSEEVKKRIINQIETVAQKAELVDGLFHCQCIINNDGTPYLIDPCRRSPGDLYLKLVELSSMLPYSKAISSAELGLPFADLLSDNPSEKCIARECVMGEKNGKYKGVIFNSEIKKYIHSQYIWAQDNEPVSDYLKYKAGIVFFEFPDKATMATTLNNLYSKMNLIID